MAARSFARVPAVRAKRAIVITVAIAAWLAYRLTDVQIRQGHVLAETALDQHSVIEDTFAKRGAIVDRDGNVLVRSLPSESVYAVPTGIGDDAKPRIAAQLSPILGYPPARIEAALREDVPFRYLKRKVPHDVAQRVLALKIDGVGLKSEETGVRFVPAGRLASTTLGFVGSDENGLDGLEYGYDAFLRGTPGRVRIEADDGDNRVALPFGDNAVIDRAVPGHTLELTLDSYLQFEAEHLVAASMKKWSARSGVAIVMDAHSGDILALASLPDFDPSHYSSATPDAWRNRAIADAYEPGSTFKLITAAAALETHRVSPASQFPIADVMNVGGRTIHNAEDGFMAGTGRSESLEDIIAYSHNVGAAEVGMRIGPQPMYRMIRNFGFGDPTGIDFPGENPGIVPSVGTWSGSSLATISFGQGISTTPIALVRAYAAIANGGLLLKPRLIHAECDENGKVITAYGPHVERRVISEATAATLRRFLRAVVVRGTGNPTAQVPGYATAGKTGTAQVVENGQYLSGAYVASFIGYVPADAPRYVILVKIERPRGAYYGSEVAAPVFADLAREVMLHAGVMPATRLVRPHAGAKAT
jgi:cell division protein FtsI/penicillin-binding protein 2